MQKVKGDIEIKIGFEIKIQLDETEAIVQQSESIYSLELKHNAFKLPSWIRIIKQLALLHFYSKTNLFSLLTISISSSPETSEQKVKFKVS